MIKITRAEEAKACPELAKIRIAELDRLRKALAGGAKVSGELIRRKYDVAKLALYEMQHYKCCYCESIYTEYAQVEYGRALPSQGCRSM